MSKQTPKSSDFDDMSISTDADLAELMSTLSVTNSENRIKAENDPNWR